MLKTAYIIGIMSGCILAVAVAYLAWANRSAKIGTGSLLAVIAVIITLVWIPQSETARDQFTVSLVIDKRTTLPFQSYYSQFGTVASSRWVWWLLSEDDLEKGPKWSKQRVVHFNNDDEKFAFYREWLHYCVLEDFYEAVSARSGVESSVGGGGLRVSRAVTYTPPETRRSYRLAGEDVMKQMSMFHFLQQQQRDIWKGRPASGPRLRSNVRLPIDTTFELAEDSITLKRPDYFTIRFSIESVGGGDGPPAHLPINIVDPNAVSLYLGVRMEAKFEGLAAENPDVVDAKAWSKAVFDRLKQDLGDPA